MNKYVHFDLRKFYAKHFDKSTKCSLFKTRYCL